MPTGITEQQKILAGIGFPIRADGDPGPLTRQAITWFQEAWVADALTVDGLWGPATEAAALECLTAHGRISEHFTLAEFGCAHCRWPRAHRWLVRGLETLRARYYAGSGLPVVSGYRCAVHNAAIGGASQSQHLKGRAADIPPRGDGGRLIRVSDVAALRLFGGLEYQPAISGRGCTHVDVRAGGDAGNPTIFAW